jgi:tetratricopeptide (TPR) repeat protein
MNRKNSNPDTALRELATKPTCNTAKPGTARRWPTLVLLALLPLGLLISFWLFGDTWRVRWGMSSVQQLLDQNRPYDAVEQLRSLDRSFPNRADIILTLAIAERRAGSLPDVEPLLDRARLLGADPEEVLIQRCLLDAQRGRFEAVEQSLAKIVERQIDDKTAGEIYATLSEGYASEYRLADAWRCLEFWMKWQPQELKMRLLRGAICQRIGNSQQAVEEYQRATQDHPESHEAWEKLGRAQLEMNQVQEAHDTFQTAFRKFPDEPRLAVGWASCQRRLGDAEAARQQLTPYLSADLSVDLRAEVFTEYGLVELESGEYSRAIEQLKAAIALTPHEPAIHHALSRAYKLAGQQEAAEEHQQTNQKLRAATQRLHEISNKLLVEPRRADLRFEAGELVAAQGFTHEALGWWYSALKVDPKHAPSHRALADLWEERQNSERARWHRQQAVSPLGELP